LVNVEPPSVEMLKPLVVAAYTVEPAAKQRGAGPATFAQHHRQIVKSLFDKMSGFIDRFAIFSAEGNDRAGALTPSELCVAGTWTR
jgi:hypothetical protein